MKPHHLLYVLLLSSFAFGQAAPAKPEAGQAPQTTKPAAPPPQSMSPEAKPQAAATPEVAPTDAVITLKGMCESKPGAPKPADCKTVVTRAQFEHTVAALAGQQASQLAPQVRQQAANKIAEAMVLSHEAERRGLQNKPEMREIFRYLRMQALMQELGRTLQAQYAHSSPEEIQKYYDGNKLQFEEVKVKRIYIPKPRPTDDKKPVDETAFKAAADKLRAEAAGGGDFDKLQKEAFENAGITTPTPPTALGPMRLANMPHKQVTEMKPGDVSQLITDPGGFYIYKMETRETVPLERVKGDIEKTLAQQKLEKAAKEITNSSQTVLNPAYFGSTGAAPGAGRGTTAAPAATPPKPPQPNPPAAPPKK